MPLLKKSSLLNRKTLYWHFPHYWWETNVQPYSIIRNGDWKLIYWYENEKVELYNIKEDLSEINDIGPQMPEKVKELEKKLKTWLDETGAKLPVKNSVYVE